MLQALSCEGPSEESGVALTIGQVADAADVNIKTIRYYERRGLFPTPRRTRAGYHFLGAANR